MIPDLPEEVSDQAKLQFFDNYVTNLENQSTHHIGWFSHKRNPSVCWICDQQILIHKILDFCEHLLSKSSEDYTTDKMSDTETDAESDEFIADDDVENYNEPEFDIEDNEL